jgi:acetyl-CoA carboxylase biotin carboxyl carrier protein
MKKTQNFPDTGKETSMASKIDFEEINRFIKLLEEKNLSQFELEIEGFKIKIGRTAQILYAPAPQAAPAPAPSQPSAADRPGAELPEPHPAEGQAHLHFVTSPMVGTFYRAPAPNSSPFVEIGDPVKKKQTLCIVEAMKLMNEIECDLDGTIKEIFVENGKPVEYGQRLFAIVPHA